MEYQILQPAGLLPATRRVKVFKMPESHGGQWVPLLWSRRLSSDKGEAVVLLSRDPVQTMRIEFDPNAWALMSEINIEW
jgi:hypothetical protein